MATKSVKTKVIALRLTDEEYQTCKKKLDADPPRGAATLGKFARKLLLDWRSDLFKYENETARMQTQEIWMAPRTAEPPPIRRRRGRPPKVSAVPA